MNRSGIAGATLAVTLAAAVLARAEPPHLAPPASPSVLVPAERMRLPDQLPPTPTALPEPQSKIDCGPPAASPTGSPGALPAANQSCP